LQRRGSSQRRWSSQRNKMSTLERHSSEDLRKAKQWGSSQGKAVRILARKSTEDPRKEMQWGSSQGEAVRILSWIPAGSLLAGFCIPIEFIQSIYKISTSLIESSER
jgi:hypothetical protein